MKGEGFLSGRPLLKQAVKTHCMDKYLNASSITRNIQALNTSFYCPNIQKYK